VALSQARILYQNHSGDYPQVILTIPVTCRTVSESKIDSPKGFLWYISCLYCTMCIVNTYYVIHTIHMYVLLDRGEENVKK
jgi:hypothetical protein